MAYTIIVNSMWNRVIDRTWKELTESALTAFYGFSECPLFNIVRCENQCGGANLY